MENLIDSEILMMFGIFVMTFIILNIVFKFVSMPNVLKRIIIVVSVLGLSIMVYNYILEHEKEIVEDNKSLFYVVGRVDYVSTSMKKIQITYQKTNIPKSNISDEFTSVINVRISDNVPIGKVINGVTKSISVTDLGVGDIITVYCKETKLDGEIPSITPTKILVRRE